MIGRRQIFSTFVFLMGASLLEGGAAAGSSLPPAPFKPLPVGTWLDYGSWKCRVEDSFGFETVCTNGQDRAEFTGKFVLHGEQDRSGYGGEAHQAPLHGRQSQTVYLQTPRISMSPGARRAIEGLWPLTVGKRARFNMAYGRLDEERIEVTIQVTATERLNIAGHHRDVYVIRVDSDIYANVDISDIVVGGSAHTRSSSFDLPPYRNSRTFWYDPKDGIVVKSKLVWENFDTAGYGHEYELVKARFPKPQNATQTAEQIAKEQARLDRIRAEIAEAEAEARRLAARAPRADRRPAPVSANHHGIAVIIGNRSYKHGSPTVDFAHNDAAAIKRLVLERWGYRPGNVIDLRDITSADFRALFGDERNHKGQLFNWVRAEVSDVVVYYSGHGVPGLKDGRSYLLPSDGRPNLPKLTAYSLDTLLDNLKKIPARSMTVIMDACFSGNSAKGVLVDAISGVRVAPRPRTDRKITLLTAARGDQVASWDEEAKHGLFTAYLLKALSGEADDGGYGNGDGKVTLGEIRRYLDDTMTYQARRRYNRDQNAIVDGPEERILATYSRRVTAGAPADAAPAPAPIR